MIPLMKYGRFAVDIARLNPKPECIYNAFMYLLNSLRRRSAVLVTGQYPISLGVFVTMRCNLQCPFCYINWKNVPPLRKDITQEEFGKILDHWLFKRTLRVGFTGGEPLLHPQLETLIAMAFRRRLYTTLFSNGVLLTAHHTWLAKSRLNSITVSLYDAFLGQQKQGLSLLMESNRRYRSRMVVSVARIVTNNDYPVMEETIMMAEAIGIENVLFQNYYAGNHGDHHHSLHVGDKAYERFCRDLAKRCREKKIAVVFPYLLPEGSAYRRRCVSLYTTMAVDGAGNIAPCCFIVPPSGAYGNIFNDPDPWNTQFYTNLRRNLAKNPGNEYPSCKYCTLRAANDLRNLKVF